MKDASISAQLFMMRKYHSLEGSRGNDMGTRRRLYQQPFSDIQLKGLWHLHVYLYLFVGLCVFVGIYVYLQGFMCIWLIFRQFLDTLRHLISLTWLEWCKFVLHMTACKVGRGQSGRSLRISNAALRMHIAQRHEGSQLMKSFCFSGHTAFR
jgi:hypothetical protein